MPALSSSLPLEFTHHTRDEARVSVGAHSLLQHDRPPSSYLAQASALLLYGAFLGSLCLVLAPRPLPQEQPLELTMVTEDAPTAADALAPAAPPVDETPVEPKTAPIDPAPQEQAARVPQDAPLEQTPPPPLPDQPEAVAPLSPPPPPLPQEKVVKRRPKPPAPPHHGQTKTSRAAPKTRGPARASGSGASQPQASNALPSNYANLVHMRIARAAANSYPSGRHQAGRVAYHVVIGPSGELISRSITPSGNATFDRAASEALSRASPFPSTGIGRPVSLNGAIAFRPN